MISKEQIEIERKDEREKTTFLPKIVSIHTMISLSLREKKPQIDSTTIAKHVHITTTKKNLSKEKSPVSRDLFFSLRTNDCITTIVTSFSSEYIVHRIEADARSTKIDF